MMLLTHDGFRGHPRQFEKKSRPDKQHKRSCGGEDRRNDRAEMGLIHPRRGVKVGSAGKEGVVRYGKKIGRVQKGTGQDDNQYGDLPRLDAPQGEIPLADKATHGWYPDDAERPEKEGRHRDGHHLPDPPHLADLLETGMGDDGAGAEEEGYLAECVHDNMDHPACHPHDTHEPSGHDNIGKLAHRRVREPRLEVILPESEERTDDDRDGYEVEQEHVERKGVHQVNAEDVKTDSQNGKNPHLDDRNRVQERADRRRSHHGGWEPRVDGHDGGLADSRDEEDEGEDQDRPSGLPREDTLIREIEGSRIPVSDDHGREKKGDGGAHEVSQVLPSREPRLSILVVGNQRVGGQ